jgi:cysteinyl-tRNA synthetase
MLRIFNSLSRSKEVFRPLDPQHVRMYVCGMTVYDYCHLGHARVMVAFDIVQRWLRACGYRLTYVRNITDIDDKIIRRAIENAEPISALTERFIGYMNEDADALGVRRPDVEPRATGFISEMLAMIGALERNGLAYKAANGDVNFSVRKFPGYGKLSGKTLDELRAGERVAPDPTKQDPLDPVLWKHSKEGEPFWQSPWGNGRPGWHIECAAMGEKLLGMPFDIHGGGQDLLFPHHENEIAHAEGSAGAGAQFVNYWMHNGFVRVDDEKMSKSLGNFFTIREVLKEFDAEVVRFFIARTHYRSPLNYSDHHLRDARSALTRLYTALKAAPAQAGDARPDWNEPHGQRFREAMDDDFNTAEAVAVLFDLANELNRTHSPDIAKQLRALGGVLGLLNRDPEEFLKAGPASADGLSEQDIDALVQARIAAKKARNFSEADRIRDQLGKAGIILEDGKDGTTWRRA